MSSLPNNTFASPGNPYYALVDTGGGGSASLQSPVNLIPEADGTQSLEMVASTGTGNASLLVASATGNQSTITIGNTGGGDAALVIGKTTLPTGAVRVVVPGGIVPGGELQIENGSGGTPPVATFDTINNAVTLGGATTAGGTTVRNGLQVNDEFVTGDAFGISITMTAPLTGVIATTGATGSLSLGSSSLNPDIIQLTQGASAADTGVCTIGGNGGENLVVLGGTVGSPRVIVRTDSAAASAGTLCLGASVSNPQTVFITDPNGVANAGYVDITGGTVTGAALRLRGYGAGTGATISTNLGAGGVLNIQNNVNDEPPNMTLNDASTTINGLVLVPNDLSFQGSGSITAFQTFQTTGVSCGDNTTTAIANPGGLVVGLYLVLARGTIGGVSSVACSVSTTSYWNGSSWKWGGGGAAPALVTAPPSYVGIQGGGATLILANGGGLGTVVMDFTYLKLGGNLGI